MVRAVIIHAVEGWYYNAHSLFLLSRINNCVGERNQKYFIQFLVYVGTLALYAIALVIMSWVFDCPQCSNDIAIKQSRM